ncbi:hypothetical protein PAJ34TS1_11170 [Paenibacillus azoreducens]|uniref:Uncharacterized protein n=1 Tax=Paenibacillus azoreducens TaxID=116718 RepID=A0A919YCQ5_9BACL|nr:hypothetical protein J34TS1_15530 [Paenibacillus azoreducens]
MKDEIHTSAIKQVDPVQVDCGFSSICHPPAASAYLSSIEFRIYGPPAIFPYFHFENVQSTKVNYRNKCILFSLK